MSRYMAALQIDQTLLLMAACLYKGWTKVCSLFRRVFRHSGLRPSYFGPNLGFLLMKLVFSLSFRGPVFVFMSPLRRHIIRLLHGNIVFFVGFSALRNYGSEPYSAWMKYVVCLHLCIPWKFGERGSTPRGARRPSLSVCLFVFCPSRYDARHRKPRRCVYALNLGERA